jgi:coenzyme Q-binding protein COQ10
LNGDATLRRRWSRRIVGCATQTLFAIVADVERYCEFVPGCVSARIVERQADRWIVDNVFGFGPLRSHFRSLAKLEPPNALTISSRDGPWRDFLVQWRFRQEGETCALSCDVKLGFRSPLLAALARVAAGEVERRLIAAFESRALEIAKGAAHDP